MERALWWEEGVCRRRCLAALRKPSICKWEIHFLLRNTWKEKLAFLKRKRKKKLTFSLKRMIFKTLTLWLKCLSREKNYYTEYPKTSPTNCLGKSWNYMVPTVWLSSLCSDSNLNSCILYFVVSGHKCSPRHWDAPCFPGLTIALCQR